MTEKTSRNETSGEMMPKNLMWTICRGNGKVELKQRVAPTTHLPDSKKQVG
jgi:hypothetical protein